MDSCVNGKKPSPPRSKAAILTLSAAGGYLNVVQYLHTNRTEGCTIQAMTMAARHGHLDVVQFLHENRTVGCDPTKCRAVKNVATLAYLATNQLVALDPEDFHSVGNQEMIKFLYYHCVAHAGEEKRVSLAHAAMESVMKSFIPTLAVIQFLDSKRPPGEMFVSKGIVSKRMHLAASWGHLPMLKYLHFHDGHTGCTTDDGTTMAMDEAASNGFLGTVQFLHRHRSEGCSTKAMDEAASNGHLEIVQFLNENRSEGCTTRAMDNACRQGHLKVVQFLQFTRSEGCTAAALENAAECGWLEIAQFLCANRPNESCVTGALQAARREKQKYMVDFSESKLPCVCLPCRTNQVSLAPRFDEMGDY